jgi:Tol biopolymer transport system component
MEVDFEHRSPGPNDVISIGMVDLKDGDRWIKLGLSRSWCWQQGCMLQWLPGSKSEIIWNDRQGERFVCHILNVSTHKRRTLPHPIYTISPDGRTAVAPDFRRVQDMRPGYGYPGLSDPYAEVLAPKDSGIFRVDIETGRRELIISIADIASFGTIPGNPKNAKHYFNHLLFNPDGSRFIFLHRWRAEGLRSFATRMLTAGADGTDIRLVDPHGKTSHFIWRDPGHILAWAWHPSHGNAFYLYEDGTDKVEVVGKDVMTKNGHCTYLPGSKWILNDVYPDKERKQKVYLYNVATEEMVSLGRFYSPRQYTGEWRCDTHPRFSPDGQSVVIDSPHGGNGRQMYLIDISAIVG